MFCKMPDFERQHNPVCISFTQFNVEVINTPSISYWGVVCHHVQMAGIRVQYCKLTTSPPLPHQNASLEAMTLGVLSLHGHFGIKQSQSYNLDI